jgi:hypothetical protein
MTPEKMGRHNQTALPAGARQGMDDPLDCPRLPAGATGTWESPSRIAQEGPQASQEV